MNMTIPRTPELLLSAFIHILVLTLAVVLNNPAPHRRPVLIVDFSIKDVADGYATAPKSAARPLTTPARQPESRTSQPASVEKASAPVQTDVLQAAEIRESAGNTAPAEARSAAAAHARPAGGNAASGNDAKSQPAQSVAAEGEALKQAYVREHFAYIRSIVQKRLAYPQMARKMGWEGRVVISFIVNRDGTVRDLAIQEASGCDLLDRSARAAVQEAAPFPRPPVEAQILLPINYRLTRH